MSEPLFIYVDVDDTLVRKHLKPVGRPIAPVIAHVRRLHREGAHMYCWSTGGADHAREAAQRLGIDALFVGFLPKPQVFIDDEEAAEWPHFVHVRPRRLGTLKSYRARVAAKKDGDQKDAK